MKVVRAHRRILIVLGFLIVAGGAGAFAVRGPARPWLSRLKASLTGHQAPATPNIDPESLKNGVPDTTRTEVRRGTGTAYYVSPKGNDTNAGTADAPFLTLQRAADEVRAGDTVLVRAGSYPAGMNLYGQRGGTAENPICLLAEPGVAITHAAVKGTNAATAAINIESCGGFYVVQGFRIVGDGSMQKAGIRVALTDHVQILNNTIQSAFTGIFVSGSDHARVQGNICFNSSDEHGIYMSNTHDYVVKGNILSGNAWDGLHLNMMAGKTGSINSGGLIESNLIRANHLSGIDMEAAVDCVFRNNLVYANSKHGVTLHNLDQDAATPPCTDNLFVNNTIVGNGMSAIQMADGGNTANTLFNNILLTGNRSRASLSLSGEAKGLKSDYNAVSALSMDLGKTIIELSQWAQQTGQDNHSVGANPADLFVNVARDDFHLAREGLAVNKGIERLFGKDAPAADLEGTRRPQGAGMDLGAYEWHDPSPR